MKKKQAKTNALRILDSKKIPYELRQYEVDDSDLSGRYVADKIGMPPRQVFKTLVVTGNKTGIVLACVPTDSELDLKELARVSGNKKMEMSPVKDINRLTGYIRGGVSPVGTKKSHPVFLDAASSDFPVISLSAGVRGIQMLVNPDDLTDILDIHIHPVARKSS